MTARRRASAGRQPMRLTVVFTWEDGQWSVVCTEFGTAACGDTFQDAAEAIGGMIPLHFAALDDVSPRVLASLDIGPLRKEDLANGRPPSTGRPSP